MNERALKISGDVLDVVKCEDATDVFRVCVLDEDPVARSRHLAITAVLQGNGGGYESYISCASL